VRKENKNMNTLEIRSALEAGHNKGLGELPAMPDWAVRRIFESRSGLPLTPLPREVEARRIHRSTTAPAPNVPAVTESEREVIQRRIRAAQISFLQ
jgi:hypothetical protein